MSTTSLITVAVLPSERERQQLFFMLQMLSSVTAWRRIEAFYAAWSAVAQNSLREAEKHGWSATTSLPKSTCLRIETGLSALQSGVSRLAKGDRRVFMEKGGGGDFSIARDVLFSEAFYLSRIEMGENGIDGEHTPLWREYTDAMKAACQAWLECEEHVLESRSSSDGGQTVYDAAMRETLAMMPFPVELPRLPVPIKETFMRTGEWAKFNGIWEPIFVEKSERRSFLSMFERSADPLPPFKIVGAMNYLRAYDRAPKITVETADGPVHRATTWRLLWRDDRYIDGVVPEQEACYRFAKPPPPPVLRPLVSPSGQTSWAQSGTAAWAGGVWLLESDLHINVRLQKNDPLPLHRGKTVLWLLAEE